MEADLARGLALTDKVAAGEGGRYWGWEGYTAGHVKAFLAQGTP